MALEVDLAVQDLGVTETESQEAVLALVAVGSPVASSAMAAVAFRTMTLGTELGMAAATWAFATCRFL